MSRDDRPECPLCAGSCAADLGENPDFPPAHVWYCDHCGLGVTWRMPDPETLRQRYREEYRLDRSEGVTTTFLVAREERAQAQLAFVLGESMTLSHRSDLVVLDVGCAAGSLLAAWSSRAAKLTGYEPDILMAAKARELLEPSAEIYTEMYSPRAEDAGSFDVVSMSHVLEHVTDPVETLRGMFGVLKEDGALFLEVPNETPVSIRSLCAKRTRGVYHLLFFSPSSLRSCIALAGGRVERLATFGDDLHEPPFTGRGGWRRLRLAVSRRLFRGAASELRRLRRAVRYENPRGGLWLRCLCVPAARSSDVREVHAASRASPAR